MKVATLLITSGMTFAVGGFLCMFGREVRIMGYAVVLIALGAFMVHKGLNKAFTAHIAEYHKERK